MESSERERLGEAVRVARLQAGLAVPQAAAAGGISRGAWERVERGEPSRELTLAAVERALHWPSGACARVLRGEAPPAATRVEDVPVTDPSTRAVVATMRELSAADRERLAALAEAYLRSARGERSFGAC